MKKTPRKSFWFPLSLFHARSAASSADGNGVSSSNWNNAAITSGTSTSFSHSLGLPTTTATFRDSKNKQLSHQCAVWMVLFALLALPPFLPHFFLSSETLQQEEEYLWKLEEELVHEIEQQEESMKAAQVVQVDPVVMAASLRSTATLISSMLLGVLCAKYGVLDANAMDALARLAYHIFEPALMLVSISKTLNTRNGLSHPSLLVVMPLASILHTLLGYWVGRLAVRVLPMPKVVRSESDARDIHFCSTFSNSVNLPMVFAASLFHSSSMANDIIAAISFYVLLICPIFYTMGVPFLQTPQERGHMLSHQLNNTRTSSVFSSLEQIINPPVMGACAGIFLGSVPLCRKVFLSSNGWGAPLFGALQTFGQAYLPSTILVLSGSMAAASNRSDTTDHGEDGATDKITASGKKTKSVRVDPTVSNSSILIVAIIKFVIWPLGTIGICHFLFGNDSYFLTKETPRNRAILQFVVMLEGCMPPAQNSVLLFMLAGMKERAYRMTRMLTVLYLLSILPVTFHISRALSSTQIMKFVELKKVP